MPTDYLLALLGALLVSACSGDSGAPGGAGDTREEGFVEGENEEEETTTIESILPLNHTCRPTLLVLAQEMTGNQLNTSCAALAAKETQFHQLLQTGMVPAADDHNDQLRVVVLDDYDNYTQYAYELFDINTDNGGIYIEGNPADPDNLASFYAHEAQWLRPEFVIWNLEHEYVHYLEWRFVSYGGFNHFPGNLVWWSEGLAEYLSMGTENPEAIELLRDALGQSELRKLRATFDTDYTGSVDEIYNWTYLVVHAKSCVTVRMDH